MLCAVLGVAGAWIGGEFVLVAFGAVAAWHVGCLMIHLAVPEDETLDAPICDRCGYGLTGNVTGRCPECGTPTGELPIRYPDPPTPDESASTRS